MLPERPITGDPGRWPHLEACYDLARRAAAGFAPGPCAGAAFTAARWGMHMGLAIARLAPELAAAVDGELDDYDLTRDGLEAATHARFMMTQDVRALERLAQRFARGETDPG
jgi:hypothetical protein